MYECIIFALCVRKEQNRTEERRQDKETKARLGSKACGNIPNTQ